MKKPEQVYTYGFAHIMNGNSLPDLPTLSVTSDYGPRSVGSSNHYGVDFSSLINYILPYGHNLNAPCDGIISEIGSRTYSGNYLVIQGDNLVSYGEGEETIYPLYFYFCHLYGASTEYQQLAVNSIVSKGDLLGLTSDTDGFSPSNVDIHLHMSVTTSGNYNNTSELRNIDPLMFFDYNEYE